VYDSKDFDVFFIKVNSDFGQVEQLLNLIGDIHDIGKKLIVVTDNEKTLQANIAKELSATTGQIGEDRQRISDRAKNLLLPIAEWKKVTVKASSQRTFLYTSNRESSSSKSTMQKGNDEKQNRNAKM